MLCVTRDGLLCVAHALIAALVSKENSAYAGKEHIVKSKEKKSNRGYIKLFNTRSPSFCIVRCALSAK